MDLLVGAKTVIVATTHLTRKGEPKIVEECSFPLTGDRPASLIVTEHATFSVDEEGLVLEEVAPSSTLEWVRSNTPVPFRNSATLETV
jgi:3-oxoacid CoA-transferase B subunit